MLEEKQEIVDEKMRRVGVLGQETAPFYRDFLGQNLAVMYITRIFDSSFRDGGSCTSAFHLHSQHKLG